MTSIRSQKFRPAFNEKCLGGPGKTPEDIGPLVLNDFFNKVLLFSGEKIEEF